ncbi:hypothetical protein G7Y89_g9840 [Cudoniella acicularis]|uniref:Uncharacterized protein n=1 Tax=Cudoniella acicularis TaxID=354080 RepID=A0A8H4RHK8_9HELO|nr:hypothetical protein G7Y89_g9840 [Cudoniella acicularis]
MPLIDGAAFKEAMQQMASNGSWGLSQGVEEDNYVERFALEERELEENSYPEAYALESHELEIQHPASDEIQSVNKKTKERAEVSPRPAPKKGSPRAGSFLLSRGPSQTPEDVVLTNALEDTLAEGSGQQNPLVIADSGDTIIADTPEVNMFINLPCSPEVSIPETEGEVTDANKDFDDILNELTTILHTTTRFFESEITSTWTATNDSIALGDAEIEVGG